MKSTTLLANKLKSLNVKMCLIWKLAGRGHGILAGGNDKLNVVGLYFALYIPEAVL